MTGGASATEQPGARTYGEVAAEMVAGLPDVLFPAIERLSWSRDRLVEHQRRELHETLAFAVARSPWHATRLGGIDVAAIEPDNLAALPVMTKRDLMSSWDEIVTDDRLDLAAARAHLERVDAEGAAVLLEEYHVFATGGSTGEPAVFCLSRGEVQRWAASVLRWMAVAGLGPPERTAWVGARSLRHPSAAIGVLLSGGTSSELVVPVDQPVTAIVARLNELAPDSLWVVSSMLPALVAAAEDGSLRLTVDRISVGGDALDPIAAERAEAAFGVRPIEGYPTTDVGHVAQQTPGEPGLYVNEDLLLVEPVDADDHPAGPGALCHHLLVTSLHQRTLPLVRYRLDDRVRIDPAPGRYPAFRRIAEIDGRCDDLFDYRSDDGPVTVHPHVFRTVLSRHAAVTDFLVEQTDDGARVAVVAAPGFDEGALGADLVAALRRAGLRAPRVTVAACDALPRTAVGKRRRFVPLRS